MEQIEPSAWIIRYKDRRGRWHRINSPGGDALWDDSSAANRRADYFQEETRLTTEVVPIYFAPPTLSPLRSVPNVSTFLQLLESVVANANILQRGHWTHSFTRKQALENYDSARRAIEEYFAGMVWANEVVEEELRNQLEAARTKIESLELEVADLIAGEDM